MDRHNKRGKAKKRNPGKAPIQDCHNKDIELKSVAEYLSKHTATATMTAVALNIYRPNLCRHKRPLEKKGLLFEIKKGACAITGYTASYLTTDQAHKPNIPQMNLF